MNQMLVKDSYCNDIVHRNVQKRTSEGMGKVGCYTREENNVLTKEDSKNGYKVRLHFTEDKENCCMIEELQKLLVGTYINNLLRRGER
ncbi:MAG: hypothetical protein K2P40_14945 [Lachnospiraceae bacterium]|jgi:hypothetical protein|nr:hypothetical protein [Lachnospiraceae bacterium]MDE6992476.1 hypothetical protein [Lachnospiraceae bacterium]MDE7000642.1 hypothetical protein [Lachnospiraceae bacterium]